MLQRQSRRWIDARGLTAVRALAVLTAVGCCLGAAAYAATGGGPVDRGGSASRPLRPYWTEHPERSTTDMQADFDFAQPRRPPARANPGNPLRYRCRLDRAGWTACGPPVRLRGIELGRHRFEVRAVNAAGRSGPTATFAWRRHRVARNGPAPVPAPPPVPSAPPVPPTEPTQPTGEGLPFSIVQTASIPDLHPGEAPVPIPLRLENPNPVPISVTALSATVAASPPGCPSAENFDLAPAGASAMTPVAIPAESSVELPAQRVSPPTIAMRELPVSQDACQGAELTIDLAGEATG